MRRRGAVHEYGPPENLAADGSGCAQANRRHRRDRRRRPRGGSGARGARSHRDRLACGAMTVGTPRDNRQHVVCLLACGGQALDRQRRLPGGAGGKERRVACASALSLLMKRGALGSTLGDIGGVCVDEMLAREFVMAAKEMNESLTLYQMDQSRGKREARRQLIRCATTGCALLSNDDYVQALVSDARALQEQRWHYRRDKRAITGRAHFERFLVLSTFAV
jgi:hypothetical protein